MSVKAFLFDVTAAGSFDGTTDFSLPSPLPTQGTTGQYTIPVTVAAGRLNADSIGNVIGQGMYWIRALSINNSNAAVIRAMVSLQQPKPSISVSGNDISHPIFLQSTNALVDAQPPIRRGPVVPPGWLISLLCDDGAGTPVVGPYQVVLELESLPQPADAARAIRSMEYPGQPVTIS